MMQMDESLNALWTQYGGKSLQRPVKLGKIKPLNKATLVIRITLLSFVLLTLWGFVSFDYKNVNLLQAGYDALNNFKTMFLEPWSRHFSLLEGVYQVLITLGISVLTTLIGGVIALFFGLLAAQNLSSKRTSNLIKGVVAFIRAVPTVLWVLIFAVAAGLGSVAAVIGLAFHSAGYLIKAYSETFEEMDRGVIEALRGSGANWWQVVFQAVIPSSVTYLLSWTFIRFEVNFTNAVAVGAAAGAGGIGFELFMASGYYFDIREVGLITYLILAIAVLLEVASTKMKVRLKGALD